FISSMRAASGCTILIAAQRSETTSVHMADGTSYAVSNSVSDAIIEINNYTDRITLDSIPLTSYDIILGEPWLSDKDCHINWKERCVSISHGDRLLCLSVHKYSTPSLRQRTTPTSTVL